LHCLQLNSSKWTKGESFTSITAPPEHELLWMQTSYQFPTELSY
jgi:hypothetical protein